MSSVVTRSTRRNAHEARVRDASEISYNTKLGQESRVIICVYMCICFIRTIFSKWLCLAIHLCPLGFYLHKIRRRTHCTSVCGRVCWICYLTAPSRPSVRRGTCNKFMFCSCCFACLGDCTLLQTVVLYSTVHGIRDLGTRYSI